MLVVAKGTVERRVACPIVRSADEDCYDDDDNQRGLGTVAEPPARVPN